MVPYPSCSIAARFRSLKPAGFNDRKRAAIEQLGYGTNAKLHLQFNSRLWNETGPWGIGNGASYTDAGYQCTWENTRAQAWARVFSQVHW